MNGILLVDKPAEWTSNDVVQKLRGILHERRIGHAGTLDPMATGLLTVFVGRATRAVEFAEADAKRYRAGLRLGLSTDTQDTSGTVLHSVPQQVKEAELSSALLSFQGTIQQVPPMYSAVKVNGERLYRLARKGETVERAPRTVTVDRIRICGRDGEDWMLDVSCSKGTYIRTLCHDIGETLGCGGCMSSLRRLEAGLFKVENALTLEQIQEAASAGAVEQLLLPADSLFLDRRALVLNAGDEKRVRNGGPFRSGEPDGPVRLYSASGEFLAIAEITRGECRPIKSFFEVSVK
ncbi:MAG: tRNA pseudouridine(55) synthase TruB [Oscillospiraceae bacterium]|nr:tRNA pseudouridine(55) synthase TruB [Oscillospiraceae bacterium]